VDLICIAPCREHTSKALRYGTRSQEISQFYLHTPRSSANGMNHTCLVQVLENRTRLSYSHLICKNTYTYSNEFYFTNFGGKSDTRR